MHFILHVYLGNSKYHTTERKERQNGRFGKEDQLNGPSMEAKDYSEDDDMIEVSKTNNAQPMYDR